ncbi:MAG: hypothetical protein V8Q84_09040 [Bilophila sp.]
MVSRDLNGTAFATVTPQKSFLNEFAFSKKDNPILSFIQQGEPQYLSVTILSAFKEKTFPCSKKDKATTPSFSEGKALVTEKVSHAVSHGPCRIPAKGTKSGQVSGSTPYVPPQRVCGV